MCYGTIKMNMDERLYEKYCGSNNCDNGNGDYGETYGCRRYENESGKACGSGGRKWMNRGFDGLGKAKGFAKGAAERAADAICELFELICGEAEMEPEEVYMAAYRPGEPVRIIPEEEAEEFLPCFGEDDRIELAPGLDLVISYDEGSLVKGDGKRYMDGNALIYAVDDEGEVMPLTAGDIYCIQQMAAERTVKDGGVALLQLETAD